MKTLYSILLCGLLCAATMTANAQTWNCGYPNAADVTATLANGVLTISGTGAMTDYSYYNYNNYRSAPWVPLRIHIKEVIIETGVTSIGSDAFYYCGNLTFVSIPASITTIGENAFYGCIELTTVTIPKSVAIIGNSAFYYCTSLTAVINYAETPQTISTDVFLNVDKATCTLQVPASAVGLYKAATAWKDFKNIEALPTTYTVTFNTQGGSEVDPQTIEYGTKATQPTDPTHTGYTFGGWYKEADCITLYDFNDDITADITLYAKWTINSYTVTFNTTQGGSEVDPQTVEYGNNATQPTDPTRAGYTFGGWYKEADGTTLYDFNNAVTAGITLYAKWIINSYTVTFNTQGGSDVDLQTVEYGAKATQPTDPTRAGYIFGGWYKETDCITIYNFNDAITADITLYAKWIINSYTVTFEAQGGSDVDPQTVEYGAKATQPTDPIRTGYTFGGWHKEADCITLYDFNDAVTADITLYAKWTEEENVTGVSELDTPDMKAYPNPFTDVVRIAGSEGCILRIVNSAGVVVHTQKITNADDAIGLEHLPAGVYFLQLEKDGKTKTVTVVKQ